MYMSAVDMRIMLQSLARIQREAGSTISGILNEVVPEKYTHICKLGPYGWQCEDSPVGLCVYDSINDPASDQCIFCGDPDERK